ncbi:LysR family transcriptional regulator [Sneathiella chungangensis]|uniref:LysR family transcriptional regulator n=1 Tax=Sneathiella chungangensis TaxID=1418234 RepID=A0A845MD96_9PROT|nr:LysR family transcriptional regulator [Sneathiella chungangensis]
MDLRALSYFVTVAELQSFSKASAHLRIAQPAISRQIQKLEEELGVTLLTRSKRKSELTEAGKVLLDHSMVLLKQVDKIKTEVTDLANEPTGRVTIAAVPSAGQLLMPPLIERYEKLYPRMSLSVVEAYTSIIESGLTEGRFDLGLIYDPQARGLLDMTPLFSEPLYLIGPQNTKLNISDECGIDVLTDLPLVMASRPNSLRILLDRAAMINNVTLNIIREIDSLAITKTLIRRGFGYSLMGFGAVHEEVLRGELSAAPMAGQEFRRSLTLSRPTGSLVTNAMTATIELIENIAEELVETGKWRGIVHRRNKR